MKKYEDGQYAPGKKCARCGTECGVFYDRRSDFFLCGECEYEINKKR